MKLSRVFAAVTVAALVPAVNLFAAPISVAIVVDGASAGPQVAAQLNDDTFFDFTATHLAVASADSLAELAGYDVVILGASGFGTDHGYTAAMFAAMRQFMTAGGGIVTVGWYNFATDVFGGLAAIDADYITPIADNGYDFHSNPGTIDILSNAHPITAGLSDFAASGNNIEYETGIDAGAVTLGSIVGTPSAVTIAYQDLVGRSVYLGGIYLANQPGYGTSGLRTGVQDQLLEQAVAWASEASAVAVVPEPSSALLLGIGIVAVGGRALRRRRHS